MSSPEPRWRVGRRVGRTVYAMAGPEPSEDDVLIGVMDTPDLARRCVEAHNSTLNPAAVDAALREVVTWLDYDLHKSLERDEETGEDTYGEHVDRFISEYRKAAGE